MLTLVLSLALGQCTKDVECKGDRICVAGQCVQADGPRALTPQAQARRDLLLQQRPGFVAPIVTLAVGAAFGATVALFYDWRAGLGIASGLLTGGLSWLLSVLWARSRIGQMLDELER